MSVSTTATTTTTATTRDPLAPITLLDVTDLKAALQALGPKQQATLTADALADAEYEDFLENRFARYGY